MYAGGRLDDIRAEFRHEVAEVRWLPLADATTLAPYGRERQTASRAIAVLEAAHDV